MAKTVTMAMSSGMVIAGQATNFVATVANGDSSAVTLSSLTINEQTKSGASISQPGIIAPNTPQGTGYPTINASSSVSYGFQVMFPSPNMPGASPSNAPGGAAPNPAYPVYSTAYLQAIGQTSDGSVFSATIAVPVLSAVTPQQSLYGGAAQFGQAQNSSLIAVI